MWILAVPFLVLAVFWLYKYEIYALQGHNRPERSVTSAVLKCLPILYLILLVRYTVAVDAQHRLYRDNLAWGLIFSMAGDFFLTWFKKLFIPGVLSFGTAHVFYILAFQMEPTGPLVTAVPFALLFVVMVPLIIPNLEGPVMKLAVAIYIGIISTMGWRAAAQYGVNGDLPSLVGLWGAVIFIVSDMFIALTSWVLPGRVPRGVFIIMVTYYAGQALLATSVLLPAWQTLSRRKFMAV